jgi:ribosomal protein S18 acetylase RimI-like enzyme
MMRWDPRQPVPVIAIPSVITFRQSILTSEEEQTAYLEAFRACFPDTPKTIEEFQMLLQSPLWEKGRAITAYSSANEYIGSILVYCDDQRGCGVTDDVMVLPGWRGRGIAKSLISEGLRYFKTLDITDVRLEVKASNAPAISVYAAMGYSVINQECLLGKYF